MVDFNFCDFDMIVARSELNAALKSLVGPAIQRIPVAVEKTDIDFEILNSCELVQCIDESRSLFTKWGEADGRPEKVGNFRMIVDLKIDTSAVRGHHIFRVKGWQIALVVSQEVKDLLEFFGASGLDYLMVD